jgi:hypothetical protein
MTKNTPRKFSLPAKTPDVHIDVRTAIHGATAVIEARLGAAKFYVRPTEAAKLLHGLQEALTEIEDAK